MSFMDEAVTMFDVSVTHGALTDLLPAPTRDQIFKLERALEPMPQLDLPPKHHFAQGMYGRELFIPAGSVVVGKIHRHEHFALLLSGEATVVTDQGREHMVGPKVWVSPAGAKRALVTHTDCVFFTTHLNADDTRDLEAIEAYVIEPPPLLEQDVPAIGEFADELQGVYA